MQSVLFQRIENGVLALLIFMGFVQLSFAWWWLLALFLLFDVSMIGYVFNKTVGAVTYNIGHSYFGPAVLLIMYITLSDRAWAFVALAWAFHIAVDRAMGYGLKKSKGFEHTHLGVIGNKH